MERRVMFEVSTCPAAPSVVTDPSKVTDPVASCEGSAVSAANVQRTRESTLSQAGQRAACQHPAILSLPHSPRRKASLCPWLAPPQCPSGSRASPVCSRKATQTDTETQTHAYQTPRQYRTQQDVVVP
eukprot:3611712-Rhodomonas_salina.3